MAFNIQRVASNFISSRVNDAKNSFSNNISAAVTQRIGGIGPLSQMAANFTNQTGGFGGGRTSSGGTTSNRSISRAIISPNNTQSDASDWRVKISVPEIILKEGDILSPLRLNSKNPAFQSGGAMIFPFNPTVLLSHSANYSAIQPTHTNFPYQAYENSQVDAITLTGEFFQENANDAKYWLACLHFLRSATKMFYGNSDPLGNPPVVCRLNGYGKHVLNNIPVVITNFTTDLPVDVDYISCTMADGNVNYVPTQSSITVTLQPQYARRSQSGFSLNQYAAGGHIDGLEGFV